MTDSKKKVKEVYNQGIKEVHKVLTSLDSTPEQIEMAEQSLSDLTAMMLAHNIEEVKSRTALLAGLIVELNQVVEEVQVEPPYQEAINT